MLLRVRELGRADACRRQWGARLGHALRPGAVCRSVTSQTRTSSDPPIMGTAVDSGSWKQPARRRDGERKALFVIRHGRARFKGNHLDGAVRPANDDVNRSADDPVFRRIHEREGDVEGGFAGPNQRGCLLLLRQDPPRGKRGGGTPFVPRFEYALNRARVDDLAEQIRLRPFGASAR